MFRPKHMKKARIIVMKADVEKLIRDLHEAGLVDIRKARHAGLDEGRPLSAFDEVSAELLKLRSMLSVMKKHVGDYQEKEQKILNAQEALFESKSLDIGVMIRKLSEEESQLRERMAQLESDAQVVGKLLDFRTVDFSKLRTATLDFKVGEISSGKAEMLQAKLDRDLRGEATVISDVPSDVTLVLYEKAHEADVDNILNDIGFEIIDLPEGITSPSRTADTINAENEAKKKRLAIINKELGRISRENIGMVRSLLASLEVQAERAGVASRFASSKCTYIIEGWILEDSWGNLEKLVDRYGADAVLQDAPFGHDETPPTVLGNPGVANPFAFLTKSYSLPNYFELDPTMAYFIGLPIIYGMIVGDFIYGLISIVLGYLLMKKFEKSFIMRNVSAIWFYSGFVTLIFGVIYDEFGGFTHQMLLNYLGSWVGIDQVLSAPLYTGFLRMKNILPLVAMTALIGMIHLAFGFILGAINEWNHNRKHSFAKVAWLGVELGMLLALIGAIGLVDSGFMMAGLVVLVLSVIVLGMTEGIIGIIELPGLLGNILSYTRIAAIGIVGIVIAEFLLNQFVIPMPEHGIFAIILLPLFIAFHIMNAFLAMFESLVQGGRLNIVEFRSKFLHGGGEAFEPFTLKTRY